MLLGLVLKPFSKYDTIHIIILIENIPSYLSLGDTSSGNGGGLNFFIRHTHSSNEATDDVLSPTASYGPNKSSSTTNIEGMIYH